MKKLLSTTIAVGLFTSMTITPVFADVAANALPKLNTKTNAEVSTTGSRMDIKIGNGDQGGVGTLNWKSFNVGKDAHVNYEFSAHNQTAVNKVDAAGGLSQIYGKITDSGCMNCGYEGSGKIILMNPNGVLFGDGASVNVNSFTVSTLNGTFNKDKNIMEFTKDSNQSNEGITVAKGAEIYGDKNVAFATNNINVYNGSKISTNIRNNVGDTAYGKVKLVTADGVNFEYYNNGAIKEVKDLVVSNDKMYIALNGDVNSGHIDVRNWSAYDNGVEDRSEINLNGATLKATKAVKGNDGNIWLTSVNSIVSENSKYNAGGDIRFLAGKKVSLKTSELNAAGNVDLISQANDVAVDETKITAAKDINITAKRYASVQNKSELNAKNINIKGGDVYLTTSNLTASEKINGEAETGDIGMSRNSLNAEEINLKAANDVYGDSNVNNNLVKITAGNNIDVELLNIGNREKGLVAEAGKNVTITTPGTLSVSSIISKNGDVTLNADNVIAGLPYTDNEKIPGDDSPRSYIYVKNGTFTSNTANDSFEVTASDTITADGKHKERHHIQYGNGQEKILLINDRPFEEDPQPTPPPGPTPPEPQPPVPPVPPVPPYPEPQPEPTPAVDGDQAAMLNRIPRQPEVYKVNNNIADSRTTFVDVFAAASQIEIEDDDEEE